MKTQFQLLLIALLCLATTATSQADQSPLAVSVHSRSNQTASGGSFLPTFSGDGTKLLFVSYANNLVTNDDLEPNLDVFVSDLASGDITLISVNTNSIGGGNADALTPVISSNGQFVVFASTANNLVTNDTNEASDIFLRDTVAGTTELISVAVNGSSPPKVLRHSTNGLSRNPIISADGRWVFFESDASNLVAEADSNQATDIFARDRQSGTTVLVSVNTNGTAPNAGSKLGEITPDGRYAVFTSAATDLVAGDTSERRDVFVRDLELNVTHWISRDVDWSYNYEFSSPVVSTNGRYVSFVANIVGYSSSLVFFYDLVTGAVDKISSVLSDCETQLQLSKDGRFVVFYSTDEHDASPPRGMFRWDRDDTNLLTLHDFRCPNWQCDPVGTPILSDDGNQVLFLLHLESYPHEETHLYLRDITNQTTILVNADVNGLTNGANMQFSAFDLSSDGRYVAFDSANDNFAQNDLNQVSDVFVRDTILNTTRLISRRHPDLADTTGTGTTILSPNAISADGRIIAYLSTDTSIIPNDTNELVDLLVRDLESGFNFAPDYYRLFIEPDLAAAPPHVSADGKVVILSQYSRYYYNYDHGTDGWLESLYRVIPLSSTIHRVTDDGYLDTVRYPTLSSDGMLIAYERSDEAIVIRDFTNGTEHVPMLIAHRDSRCPQFSPNDQWLIFQSRDITLTTNEAPQDVYQFYSYNLARDQTHLLSYTPSSEGLPYSASNAVFTADSRWVVFQSGSTIYRHRLGSSTSNELVWANGFNPSASADGRWVAFEQPRDLYYPTNDLHVIDLQTVQTELINVNRQGTGPAIGPCSPPIITPDGRLVVFSSHASDLVPNDSNNASDVFVRFRASGVTIALSQSMLGNRTGNGPSSHPVLSADGRTVVFQSFASDLVTGDYNDKRDIFVARLGSPDSDGDEMDDDWELAYFDTLDRDGAGDFDLDGSIDIAEFLAGTDPTNQGSALCVLTISSPDYYGVTILWSAVVGRSYVVQYKDSVDDPNWTNLSAVITATSPTGMVFDSTAWGQPQRYYRVVLAP